MSKYHKRIINSSDCSWYWTPTTPHNDDKKQRFLPTSSFIAAKRLMGACFFTSNLHGSISPWHRNKQTICKVHWSTEGFQNGTCSGGNSKTPIIQIIHSPMVLTVRETPSGAAELWPPHIHNTYREPFIYKTTLGTDNQPYTKHNIAQIRHSTSRNLRRQSNHYFTHTLSPRTLGTESCAPTSACLPTQISLASKLLRNRPDSTRTRCTSS